MTTRSGLMPGQQRPDPRCRNRARMELPGPRLVSRTKNRRGGNDDDPAVTTVQPLGGLDPPALLRERVIS